MPLETIQQSDSPTVRKQIKELQKHGHRIVRHTVHQLKIGPISYYPVKGTIVIDPCSKHSEKGFEALLDLLQRSKPICI